jgi:hypothetical protein
MFNSLSSTLAAMKKDHQSGTGARDLLLSQRDEKTESLSLTRREISYLDAEQVVLSFTSRSMMSDVTDKIEEPVSLALQMLWGDDRMFKFRFPQEGYRGEPAAYREVLKRESPADEYEPFDPDEQSGGGISDTVSLILDLSIMRMLENPVQGLISRDEPGKFVDKENGAEKAKNIAFFLKEYVRRTGVQFLFITHVDQLKDVADRAFEVQKVREMTSRVVRVK